MAKLEIFGHTEEKEKTVTLRLEPSSGGSVRVVAVDENGQRVSGGYLLSISPSGTFCTYAGLNKELFGRDKLLNVGG